MSRRGRTGEDRVKHVTRVMDNYASISGPDRHEQLIDVLTDLWLFAREHKLAFHEAMETAEEHGVVEWRAGKALLNNSSLKTQQGGSSV